MIWRKRWDQLFRLVCAGGTAFAIIILIILVSHIAHEGYSRVSFDFLNNFASRFPDRAGIKSGLIGTLWMMGLTSLFSIPIGLCTAIYLEEYGVKGKFGKFIELNISNLAAVPSIIYGLLGLAVFVRFFGLGQSLWSGSLTLALLILPVIIISSREALKDVPISLRMAAYALGAKRWQVVFGQVLPAALPGILTGIILSLSRAIGETAPLIVVGALNYVAFVPTSPSDQFTVLPIQIFNWASRPQVEFHQLAAAAILVLLVVMFLMNLGAIILRNRSQKGRQW